MELFHTLSRGVDKRIIFQDDKDRFRFIHDLYEFNDQNLVNGNFYRFQNSNVIARRNDKSKPRKLLVDIHCFCLMPNHYHLLLSPRIQNGIPKFMKKLNMGYARYFNTKYKRTGALFEGRYKSVPITEETHFIHIPYYIHLNPLDLCAPEWRERRMNNSAKAINFLENYRWSSYLDYIGQSNFPSVTARGFLTKFFSGSQNYKKDITSWIKEMNQADLAGFILESNVLR